MAADESGGTVYWPCGLQCRLPIEVRLDLKCGELKSMKCDNIKTFYSTAKKTLLM